MSFFLIKKIKFKINLKDEKLVFLLLTTIVPIFLMLFTSMIMGAKIRTMWMTPFYLFAGTFVIYIFKSQINLNKLKILLQYSYFYFLFLHLFMHMFQLQKQIKELIFQEKKCFKIQMME